MFKKKLYDMTELEEKWCREAAQMDVYCLVLYQNKQSMSLLDS